jgi:hypothetical protein
MISFKRWFEQYYYITDVILDDACRYLLMAYIIHIVVVVILNIKKVKYSFLFVVVLSLLMLLLLFYAVYVITHPILVDFPKDAV